MVNAISGINSCYNIYRPSRIAGLAADQTIRTQQIKNSGTFLTLHRGADPETPIQPIRPVVPVNPDTATPVISFAAPSQAETYAAEQAVRFRIQYADSATQTSSGHMLGNPVSQFSGNPGLPAGISYDPAEMAVRMRIQYMDPATEAGTYGQAVGDSTQATGIESTQKASEEGRCETFEKRKYQDGSDDPSVSFQTPTQIDPDTAAATVRGHEMEHVFHEQSRAEREDRKVVSQSVSLHTDICPECGRVYVSGGTTRTVTKADNDPETVLSDNLKNDKK